MSPMICAKEAHFILGLSPATFYRRIADGSIEEGKQMGPRAVRWKKDYILSLMDTGLVPADPAE